MRYLAILVMVIFLGGCVPYSDNPLTDPNSDLKPLQVQSQNLKAGFDALLKVEENISQSAESGPGQSGSSQ